MKILGTQRTRNTAYHPIANCLVEHLHRQLKAAIKCLPNPNDWNSELTWILLSIRTGFKEDIGCSSVELVWLIQQFGVTIIKCFDSVIILTQC